MANFAAQPQDENLVYGWNNQGSFATGTAPAGFAQAGVAPAPGTVVGQAGSGIASPNGIVGNQYALPILENAGYADGNGTMLGTITPPAVPATTVAIQNPSGLASLVTLAGGTVTVVATAPFNAAGSGTATFTTVAVTSPATVTVPPGGYIKMTYSAAPTWSWVTTN